MKLKSLFFGALALAATLSSPAFSYVIYNLTHHSVYVYDRYGIGGIETSIASQASAACHPDAAGCYGNVDFSIKASPDYWFTQCNWTGKIPHAKGQIFKITETGKPYPSIGWCHMEYSR